MSNDQLTAMAQEPEVAAYLKEALPDIKQRVAAEVQAGKSQDDVCDAVLDYLDVPDTVEVPVVRYVTQKAYTAHLRQLEAIEQAKRAMRQAAEHQIGNDYLLDEAEATPIMELFHEVLGDEYLDALNKWFSNQHCRHIGWAEIAILANTMYLSIHDQGGEVPLTRLRGNVKRHDWIKPLALCHCSKVVQLLETMGLVVRTKQGTRGLDGKKGTCSKFKWVNNIVFSDVFTSRKP